MLRSLTLLTAIAAPLSAAAQNYESDPSLSVGVGLSTFGITVTPEARMSEKIGIRAPIGFFKIDDTFDIEGNDVRGDANSQQGAVLVDFYPMGGGFRVSAGLALGGYTVDARGTDLLVTDTTTGTDYTVNGSYSANIEQESGVAPMIAVGFSSPPNNRMRISIDVGAKYAKYGLSLDTSDLEGMPGYDQTDVDALIAEFDNKADDYPFTPYAHFSVAFQF